MKLMDEGERGKIHSNIPSNETLKVIDVISGRDVGDIQVQLMIFSYLLGKFGKLLEYRTIRFT